MARFYFEPNNWGPTFEDHDGVDRCDLNVARQEATEAARAFMRVHAAQGGPCPCCCIEVVTVMDSNVGTAPAVTAIRNMAA